LLEYFLQKPNPESYIGVDISEGMLVQARQRYTEYSFVHQSMIDSLERTQVDTLFYIASFHHLLTTSEQESTLSIAKKSVKIGGKLVFLNWNLTAAHLLKRYPVCSLEPVRIIPYNGNVRQYRAW
jgi:ubiquinone/menaquinone biosynthesis C-methylase UbiE